MQLAALIEAIPELDEPILRQRLEQLLSITMEPAAAERSLTDSDGAESGKVSVVLR